MKHATVYPYKAQFTLACEFGYDTLNSIPCEVLAPGLEDGTVCIRLPVGWGVHDKCGGSPGMWAEVDGCLVVTGVDASFVE